MSAACAGCHYQGPFALDLIAKILTRRQGTGDTMTFLPPSEGPQTLLDGQTISDDKSFVTAMVNSTQFSFNACRLAFQFLYGRPEQSCEGPIFDQCMKAFAADGMIQSALSAVANDTSFCQ
jgi:hypothetical protein